MYACMHALYGCMDECMYACMYVFMYLQNVIYICISYWWYIYIYTYIHTLCWHISYLCISCCVYWHVMYLNTLNTSEHIEAARHAPPLCVCHRFQSAVESPWHTTPGSITKSSHWWFFSFSRVIVVIAVIRFEETWQLETPVFIASVVYFGG